MDLLLSVPRARRRIAAETLAAIATALLLIGLSIAVLAFAGATAIGVALGPGRALLFGLNTALFAAVFGAIALVVSQCTREALTAAGATGIVLGLSYVMTSAGRALAGREWIGRLSPLYYFELNKPLIAGYPVNWGAMALLAAAASGLTVAGLTLFSRRDIGRPLALPWLNARARA